MAEQHEPCTPKKLTDVLTVIPRHASSLHELRVIANSVRVEPGRYRVLAPPPYVTHLNQPTSSMRLQAFTIDGVRRPKQANGNGQVLGKTDIEGGSFVKSMEMMPNLARKRYFAEDEDELVDELSTSKKSSRDLKRYGAHYKQMEKDDEMVNLEEVGDHLDDSEKDVLHDEHTETADHPVAAEYSEEAVEGLEGEQDQEGPYPSLNSVYIRPSHSLGIGNVQILKQLRGENSYLKDQLELSSYRIKQLEQLLLDRNVRLKSLLAENVRLGINVRKLTAEIGEDAAREVLELPQSVKKDVK